MSAFILQDTGAYLEDFMENLLSFSEAHRAELAVSPVQPLRGIYRLGAALKETLKPPSSPSMIFIPRGWEEESRTCAERFLRLRVELLLFYSGLHEAQNLSMLLAWADKIALVFAEHKQDWQGSAPHPYLYELIFTPLEVVGKQGSACWGRIQLAGLKRVKK